MIITHLLRYFMIDIFRETAYPPFINIDHTLLKRMQSGTRAHAQPPPVQLSPQFAFDSSSSSADPYSALMNEMTTMSLRQSEDTVKILANQKEFKNILAYVCSSHRYYQACVDIPLLSMSALSAHAYWLHSSTSYWGAALRALGCSHRACCHVSSGCWWARRSTLRWQGFHPGWVSCSLFFHLSYIDKKGRRSWEDLEMLWSIWVILCLL